MWNAFRNNVGDHGRARQCALLNEHFLPSTLSHGPPTRKQRATALAWLFAQSAGACALPLGIRPRPIVRENPTLAGWREVIESEQAVGHDLAVARDLLKTS